MLEEDIQWLERAQAAPTSAECDAVAARLTEALRDVPASASVEARILAGRGLVALYRQNYRTGHLGECARLLDLAVEVSAPLDPALRLDALLRRGNFGMLSFDVGSALNDTAAAMDLARVAARPRDEGRALSDYGFALHNAGLYRQADACFLQALALPEIADDAHLRGNLWALRFGALLELNDFDGAARACEHTLACADAATALVRDTLACTAWCNWAVLEVLCGRVHSARVFLASGAALPNLGKRPRWLIDVIGAMIDVRVSNTAARREALNKLVLSDAAPARSYVIETWSVLARLYASIDDRDHANEALVRLCNERANALGALMRSPEVVPARALGGGASLRGMTSHTSLALLERLAVTAELRDDATGKHCFRVGRLAMLLARRTGDDAGAEILDLAARLHDIGKIAIPDSILLKPGRLDEAEMRLMRTHTTVGADLLAVGDLDLPLLKTAEAIARHHHEWWNGGGYPAGLAGEATPLPARITALADVYDALSHPRPYKAAWPRAEVMDYIRSMRGKQFDPDLTDLFVAMMEEAEAGWERFNALLEIPAQDSAFALMHHLAPAEHRAPAH